MSHNTRAGLISAAAAVLAALVYVEAGPALQALNGPNLPGWLSAGRAFLIPAVSYGVAWATHYLLTHNPEPPLPDALGATSDKR
jgi:hypothetical protein